MSEEYTKWLENMLILCSKSYMELVRKSNEKVLKKVKTPQSNEVRHAIRIIAERAEVEHIKVPYGQMDKYAGIVIQKYPSDESKGLF